MPRGRTPDPKVAARNQEIAWLIEAGVSFAQIAQQMGVSFFTVSQAAQRQKVRSKLRSRNSAEQQKKNRELVWRLYNEWVAIRIIAERVGLSPQQVNNIINQHPDGAAFRANRGRQTD
jgi:DNA-binding CsgD family transcriptional regulator